MKCAVFPCIGLGDGLLALILSHNLAQNGHEVDTYHPFMERMQPLFPQLPLLPREKFSSFEDYDHLFFIYEKMEWMQTLLKEGLEHHRKKITVLNPIATPNRDYPFWEEGRFDGRFPFSDNLVRFCKETLHLENVTQSNGIALSATKKYPERVILHPVSSRKGKNWTKEKFLSLASALRAEGADPIFILTKEEKKEWPEVEAPEFADLIALSHFIADAGSMIGNDSGIGHLASCMGIPTLTICRSKLAADFWRPAFGKGEVIIPPSWIPNLKGMRWRDKKWQHFVPVSQVLKAWRVLHTLPQENGPLLQTAHRR